jgi:hypothetical protein
MSPVQAFLDSLSNKYEIIDLVGEGNLAQIYKARDKDMWRIVSIKLLRYQNKELMDAFDKSARKAIEISDEPNFLTIYDVHLEDSQHHYYVRQFIQGHDWGQDLRKYMNTWIESNDGGLPLERVRKIILEIGGALDKAHRKVKKPYRYTDIKPSNVLLSNDFETFISSFNICAGFEPKKIIGEFERKDNIQKDCPDFDENLLHEELSYLLPDHFYKGQIADKDVPAYEKTGQYMLGLLAYERLTGKIPARLGCLDELKDKGFDAFRQIDSIPRADCPEIVKNVILRMISKNPNKRYKRFCHALNILRNLDINLTLAKDSYLRCIKAERFSDEEFLEAFLKNMEVLNKEAHKKLEFKDRKGKVKHAKSLRQSILFLFAYFEQNERFYKNTGQREEPNILSGIAETHDREHHNIPKPLYQPFGKALIKTIAEFDSEYDDHNNHYILDDMWQLIYDSAVDYMTSKYTG